MSDKPAVLVRPLEHEHIAFAGVYVRRVLSIELFRENMGSAQFGGHVDVTAACHDRWTDLASTLAALPTPVEGALMVVSAGRDVPLPDSCAVVVLVFGRGATPEEAIVACSTGLRSLMPLLTTRLEYATIRPIIHLRMLEGLVHLLQADHCLVIARRLEQFLLVDGDLERTPIGFATINPLDAVATPEPAPGQFAVPHLFPWSPSDDDWRGLLDMFATAPASGLVVRFRGFARAPDAVRQAAHQALRQADAMVTGAGLRLGERPPPSYLAEALRAETLRRVVAVEGRVVALRVFVVAQQPPHEALVATIVNAIDDASVAVGRHGVDALFRGGATIARGSAAMVLAPLDNAGLVDCFGPREASGLLRTPMPSNGDMPGVPLDRARMAPSSGVSGTDVPLGVNVFRSRVVPLALDAEMRDRHVYIVGQTGSGKSTLMANMIVHDIRQGRGVAVLDPHGSLVDDVLPHIPASRRQDILLVDVNDVDRPVGFNVLAIAESDPVEYRRARDLIIDDLHAYLRRNFDASMMGPIFESHFRAFMGLLLGAEKPMQELTPNLALFRLLYVNTSLRQRLKSRIGANDFILEAALEEAESATGEASLTGMATYITSKFTRFTTDEVLRNLTCQASMIDFEAAVAQNKILLFQLGRGRIGDVSAGLLASMVISRLRWAVMKRGAHNGPPIHVYADEFQSFADQRMGELLAEARKFGMRLTLAHQFAAQLPAEILQAVLGNVGTVIACRVGAPDAESLERTFAPTFGRRDLVALPNFSAYVRSIGCLGQQPFSVMLPAPLPPGDRALANSYREFSRMNYGRDRKTVEREFQQIYRKYMKL